MDLPLQAPVAWLIFEGANVEKEARLQLVGHTKTTGHAKPFADVVWHAPVEMF